MNINEFLYNETTKLEKKTSNHGIYKIIKPPSMIPTTFGGRGKI